MADLSVAKPTPRRLYELQWRPYASGALVVAIVISSLILGLAVVADRGAGLRAVYFADSAWAQPIDLTNRSQVTTEAVIADAPSLKTRFSVQWSGYLYTRRTGPRSFAVPSDGATALFIDGQRLFGLPGTPSRSEGVITIDRGVHSIVVWYAHFEGRPGIELRTAAQDESPHPVAALDLSPFRRLPLTYQSISLIHLLAVAIIALWLLAGVTWIARHLPAPAFISVAVVSALFLVGVAYDWPSWLRGPAPYPREWQWGYQVPLTAARWGPAVLGALGLLGILTYLQLATRPRSVRARARLGLTCAMIAGAAFQVALLHFEWDGAAAALTQRTLSDDFTSYFAVAANSRVSVAQFLATYATEMPRRDRHATSHPPGPILYYWAILAALRQPEGAAARVLVALERVGVKRVRLYEDTPPPDLWLAAAFLGGAGIALCTALTVWPVARIAEATGADPITAAQVGALWPFCPSPALFSPQFDQVVTLLIASTCALGCMAANHRTRSGLVGAALGSGALAGLALFCSFGALPMLGAAGVVAMALTAPAHRSWRRLVGIASLAALGFAVISAVPILAGYDLLTTAREALSISRYSYMVRRGYWLWLPFNLLDFSIFLGLPLVVWGLTCLVGRPRRSPAEGLQRPDLIWTVAALVLALDLSGVTRGEIARLWMPLMPMAFVALVTLRPSAPARHPVDTFENARPSEILAERLFLGSLLAVTCVVLRLYWNPA
jgi:hypothetical protein